jgi:hypothetical protein
VKDPSWGFLSLAKEAGIDLTLRRQVTHVIQGLLTRMDRS